jgi:hypothetical protein
MRMNRVAPKIGDGANVWRGSGSRVLSNIRLFTFLNRKHEQMARPVDQPIAGLLADLKSRGLRESTLVGWAATSGARLLPTGPNRGAATATAATTTPTALPPGWPAAASAAGKSSALPTKIGLHAAEDKVTMRDLHATILTLLGLDHERLTYLFQGRNFRLTDVGGQNNPAKRLAAG